MKDANTINIHVTPILDGPACYLTTGIQYAVIIPKVVVFNYFPFIPVVSALFKAAGFTLVTWVDFATEFIHNAHIQYHTHATPFWLP